MYHMTMLQERAVQMIQDMSDDNVGFLIEVMQSWKQQEGKNMVVLMRWYLQFTDGLQISPAQGIGYMQDWVMLLQRSLHSLVLLLLVEQLQVNYIESENPRMMQNHRKVHSSPLITLRDVQKLIRDISSLMRMEKL